METKNYTLAAGQVLNLPLPDARFFMLLHTVYPIDVELRRSVDGGPEVATGVEAGFKRWAPEGQAGFAYCTITSAEAQTIKMGFSRLHHIGYDRSIGTVQVIDGTAAIVEAGRAFAAVVTQNAVAGEYSRVQLLNPVGSGRRVWVKEMTVSVSGAADVSVMSYGAPMAVLGTANVNKDFSNISPGIAQKRRETGVAGLGVESMWSHRVPAGEPVRIQFGEYVMIRPGNGLAVQCGVVNTLLQMSVQYIEGPM